MAERRGSPMTRQVHQFVALSGDVPASDASLLREFIQRRDESAFAALVRRHGPMVLGVCRRILGQPADADDAFQAVFLLLARKASSIARPERLANWLYGVALRTAWEARRRRDRQRRLEQPLADQAVATQQVPDQADWQAILDREVGQLSDKYRVPVVLCELQGRSRKEVARLLGIPEGTLSSRLAAARQRLADRLRRRGVAVTGSARASILAEHAAADSLPATLLQAAIHSALNSQATPAVLNLTEGVLMFLWLKQLKAYTALSVGLLVGVALVGYGGGMFGTRGQVRAEDKPKNTPTEAKATPAENPLLGGWRVVKLEAAGRTTESAPDAPDSLFFTADKVFLRNKLEGMMVAKYTFAPSKVTSQLKVSIVDGDESRKIHCIAEIKGDEGKLGLIQGTPADPPPESFDQADPTQLIVLHLRRDPQFKEPDAQKAAEADKNTRERADRVRRMNQLKQIALAMHNWAAAVGGGTQLPPAAIFSKDGKPLLSWRVAILPFFEQGELYKQFKLDEPWDSEHNKKLLEKMPKLYGSTGTKTHYRVFTGKNTVFDGVEGISFAKILDGTSNTLLVVEAAESVPWTKPDELVYDPEKPLPKLGLNAGKDGFLAAFADGSVRFIKPTVPETTLRWLIIVNDGNVIPDLR